MKKIFLTLLFPLFSSFANAQFVGVWVASGVHMEIQQEGSLYVVTANNPNGFMNGTFQGRLIDGELVLNQKILGNIAYLKSQDVLLFAGVTLKRKTAQSVVKAPERIPNDGLLKRINHRYVCEKNKVYLRFQAEQQPWTYSGNCDSGGCGQHQCTSPKGRELLSSGTSRDIFMDTPCLRGKRYERFVMPSGEFKLRTYKGAPQAACINDGVEHEFSAAYFYPP